MCVFLSKRENVQINYMVKNYDDAYELRIGDKFDS